MTRASRDGAREVEAYIARAPPGARGALERPRRVIRETVPDATEGISYGMPGYGSPVDGPRRMFAWFGLHAHHIGLYLRPPTIARHRRALAGYVTTKSAVRLPLDRALPVPLVQKLVRASARLERAARREGATRSRGTGRDRGR